MYRKTYFEEIWFCKEFYVGGTDILSDKNRKFIKEVALNLSDYNKTFPYKYVDNARLYALCIRGIKFKVAVAEVSEGIHIIAYLSCRDFWRCVKANDDKSRRSNDANLYKFALGIAPNLEKDDEFIYRYNKDNSVRIKINQTDNGVKTEKQTFFLNPDATIDFPEDLTCDPYKYLGWYENESEISFYGSIEEALLHAFRS